MFGLNNKIFGLFIFLTLFFAPGVSAQVDYNNWGMEPVVDNKAVDDFNQTISAFRKYKDIPLQNILVPTVFEVPFDEQYLERTDFAVMDLDNNIFLPYYFKKEISSNKIYYTVSSQPKVKNEYYMNDSNNNTFAEFNYSEGAQQNVANLTIKSYTPITSSKLTVLLDKNVALPNFVEIRIVENGKEKIVLAKSRMSSQTINFPSNTSKEWKVIFSYGQPLRINELRLVQSDLSTNVNQALRFLAQPNTRYRIYFDPDRWVNVRTSEAGNLRSNEDILFVGATSGRSNSSYEISDIDKDGHPDITDNCIDKANPDQKDLNNNGRGDVCDDFDKDGITNDKDNCPNLPNRSQIDSDKDGLGDVCDTEESRLTEKHQWIPWAGIVFALVVIIVLFFITARSKPEDNQPPTQ